MWENYRNYPLTIAEAQGHLFPNGDFVLWSGFAGSWTSTTNRSFALNLNNATTGTWREMDPLPFTPGISHTAVVIIGMKAYICGGYVGGSPGPSYDKCWVYDHGVQPKTTGQWSTFPSLPANLTNNGTRAGAAMFYNEATNTLIFTAGASRPGNTLVTIDHDDTLTISLSNVAEGWKRSGVSPFMANHIGKVTVKAYDGKQRHYMLGGQHKEDEGNGNTNLVYELDGTTLQWTQRKNMTFARGHFSESAVPYKDCGFFIAGGAINTGGGGRLQTSDISYYDIRTDTWTFVGNLTRKINTPVCTIFDGYFYCQSGLPGGYFSKRVKILE